MVAHVYVCAYACMYICMYVHVYVLICMYVCTCVNMHTCKRHTRRRVGFMRIHTGMYARARVCTHIEVGSLQRGLLLSNEFSSNGICSSVAGSGAKESGTRQRFLAPQQLLRQRAHGHGVHHRHALFGHLSPLLERQLFE